MCSCAITNVSYQLSGLIGCLSQTNHAQEHNTSETICSHTRQHTSQRCKNSTELEGGGGQGSIHRNTAVTSDHGQHLSGPHHTLTKEKRGNTQSDDMQRGRPHHADPTKPQTRRLVELPVNATDSAARGLGVTCEKTSWRQ